MKKIIGIRNNKGEYNGRSYENFTVFFQIESKENSVGTIVETHKIKPNVMAAYIQQQKLPDYRAAIGRNVELYFDQYKNVSVIQPAQ